MKYIIEIEDDEEQRYVNPITRELMIPKGFGKCKWEVSVNTGIMLTPYKESDTAEQAWEIAQQILKDPSKDGMLVTELNSCFGTDDIYIIGEMPYTEVKAKYSAWQKRKNELKIGDEVIHDTYRRCVLLEKKDGCEAELWSVIDEKGVVHQINRKHIHRKTRRTFPEVADLLEKMRNPDADH